MKYAAIALLLSSLGLGAGWWADSQRHAAEVADLRLQVMQRDLDVAAAERDAETEARAIERAGTELTRKVDDAYQNDFARLARLPVERLRHAAATAAPAGTAVRLPELPEATASADAASTDPVPDQGCDRLLTDAAKTTLMLYRLQSWADGLTTTCQPQGGGLPNGN